MALATTRLYAILLFGMALAASAGQPAVVRLEAGGHRLTAELALTPAARARGLMHRDALPEDHGMLFVFPGPEQVCMWMKDTPLPLSVAFLDAEGVIINIAEMRPLSLDSHCAGRPARYALEMAGGWFARRGLKPGMRVLGLARLPPGH
jgi:uncharacterized membrane protein (UPF0127 family)